MTDEHRATTASRVGRGAAIVAVWGLAAWAVLACLSAAVLLNMDWGDGDDDKLSTLETVALVVLAFASVVVAVWLTRLIRRRGPGRA